MAMPKQMPMTHLVRMVDAKSGFSEKKESTIPKIPAKKIRRLPQPIAVRVAAILMFVDCARLLGFLIIQSWEPLSALQAAGL